MLPINVASKLNKDFLPGKPIEGKRGFYPAITDEEYRGLPLPMKCATWDASVKYVIFDTFFADYGFSANVEVHADNAFKALFKLSGKDTQLYSVVAVRLKNGERVAAKWLQDTETGAFRIVTLSGRVLGTQGGFRGHVPENCKKDKDGKWALYTQVSEGGKITRVAF